jgi:hypothetical protein
MGKSKLAFVPCWGCLDAKKFYEICHYITAGPTHLLLFKSMLNSTHHGPIIDLRCRVLQVLFKAEKIKIDPGFVHPV